MATDERTVDKTESLGSDFVYDFVCSRCDSRHSVYVEACHYCPHCRDFYCRPCRRYACDHDLLGRADVGLAGKRNNTGQCPAHPGNKLEAFCGDHDQVCCPVCVCVDHKLEQKVKISSSPTRVRNCSNLEHSSRTAKRISQNEELDLLQKEFFSLQKRIYSLRSRILTNPKADEELLRNIRDYRAAINTLLDEFEKDSHEELQELREKCVAKIQTADATSCSDLQVHLDDFKRNLIRFRIDEATKYERVKQFSQLKIENPNDSE